MRTVQPGARVGRTGNGAVYCLIPGRPPSSTLGGKKMETWLPASLDVVQSILQEELQQLHPKHQLLIERMQMLPKQISVARYPGESVWAVAEHEDKVLYWSDVEEGWEREALQAGGALLDRGCGQFKLQHIIYQLFGSPELLP
jgi:hypothetical protein